MGLLFHNIISQGPIVGMDVDKTITVDTHAKNRYITAPKFPRTQPRDILIQWESFVVLEEKEESMLLARSVENGYFSTVNPGLKAASKYALEEYKSASPVVLSDNGHSPRSDSNGPVYDSLNAPILVLYCNQ